MGKYRIGFGVVLMGVVAMGAWMSESASGATVSTADGQGADAYVQQYYPNNNYGASTKMGISGDPLWGYVQRSFLRFDLSGLLGPNEKFASATLWLNADTTSQGKGYQYLGVYGLDDGCAGDLDGGWDEGTINWNNMPQTAGVLLDALQTTVGVTPGWHAFSDSRLVDFLNADTNGLASIRLKRIDDKNSHINFYTKENNDLIPYLEYTTVTVPEPMTMGLLAMGGLMLFRKSKLND